MRRFLGALLAILVAGCNGLQAPQIPQPQSGAAIRRTAAAPWDALYVVNTSWVDVYEYGSTVPARTLQAPHNVWLTSIAFDSAGNAYVASYGGGKPHERIWPSAIYVYRPGGIHPIRTITTGISWPIALAFDSRGYLYVANTGPAKHTWRIVDAGITVYAPGGDKPVRAIDWKQGACEIAAMLMGPKDELFVTNARDCGGTGRGNVEVYAPSAAVPSRTITAGIRLPSQVALDSNGGIYVANDDGVPVYSPGASSPKKTYLPKYATSSVAVDSEGTVYVQSGWLFVYKKGGLRARYIIQNGGDHLTLDPYENLYVVTRGQACAPYGSSSNNPCILAYGHRALHVLRIIQNYNSNPSELRFGPR